MQPLFTGWKRQIVVFQELQAKHPSGFNKIYTQHLEGYDKATYKVSFFPDECFVRKWRLKFQVSKYCLRWDAENMMSSIMFPKKNITQLPFLQALYDWKLTIVCSREMTDSTSCTCITLSLIHIWRCRRSTLCRSRWSPYH